VRVINAGQSAGGGGGPAGEACRGDGQQMAFGGPRFPGNPATGAWSVYLFMPACLDHPYLQHFQLAFFFTALWNVPRA